MKMANGSGSIVKLGGNRRKPYAVRVTVGWKNGKQQRKYIGYYASHPEAIMALGEYFKNGIVIDMNNFTLNDLYNQWIERLEKKNVSSNIIKRHEMARMRFGQLGNAQVKQIKAMHLQEWLDEIDLKPATKQKIRGTLNQLFEYAVNNDIANKNYAKSLEINEKVEKTGAIFTDEEIALLWKNQDNPLARHLLILIYTGMRIGELLAVHRDDINFEDGYLIGGSKTEAGRDRIIPIHEKIMPLIKIQLGNNKWLMQNKMGNAITYKGQIQKFNKFFKEFNMNHKTHDARKTAVSLFHTAGIPIETIRIIVGHSGDNVTEKVYLYKNPKELVKIMNSVEIPY